MKGHHCCDPQEGFEPFYERLANLLSRSLVSRFCIPATLVVLMILALGHRAFVAQPAVTPPGDSAGGGGHPFAGGLNAWVLSALTAGTMLALHYATHVLKGTLPYLEALLKDPRQPARFLNERLGTRHFLIGGALFGSINVGMGMLFEVPEAHQRFLIGYFLVGFVNGMACTGIIRVRRFFSRFAEPMARAIDFTAPDQCGGLRFVGDALIRFSAVTLFVGIGISYYILTTPWENRSPWVFQVKVLWILFPYFMAFLMLLGPTFDVSREVRREKIDKERQLRRDLAKLREMNEKEFAAPSAKEGVYKARLERIRDLEQQRVQLHLMRTFPFGLGANLQFGSALVSSFLVTGLGIANSAGDFMEKIQKLLNLTSS